ncbi:hypothetical protein GUJ93_ZPchr0010g8894 [Zizania palustris]|uniref:Uncharacterized protein n=1 Tax=Zizania palustris TaxID=103762 RepID=A0A8J5W7T3_ZIZPA|nr:hypothetical protein GUJ93_ZPchr0010g8894 [Zizania palustris]
MLYIREHDTCIRQLGLSMELCSLRCYGAFVLALWLHECPLVTRLLQHREQMIGWSVLHMLSTQLHF